MTEFIADMTLAEGLGQVCGLIALGFCIAGFANKNDDRLMVLLKLLLLQPFCQQEYGLKIVL